MDRVLADEEALANGLVVQSGRDQAQHFELPTGEACAIASSVRRARRSVGLRERFQQRACARHFELRLELRQESECALTLADGIVDARKRGAPVIETNNYYPQQRDGLIAAIEDGQVESEWVQEHLGVPVFKAFNGIWWKHLLEKGLPEGSSGRIAIPVAGDAFDLFFKANRRNLRIVHEHLRIGPRQIEGEAVRIEER